MDSGLISTLAVAITGGSTLGATIAGFFAYRQKSLVTLLRESNTDYKDRVGQLESTVDRQAIEIKGQADKITQLENEKTLPLDNLIKLITSQHQVLISAITELTTALASNEKAKKKASRKK